MKLNYQLIIKIHKVKFLEANVSEYCSAMEIYVWLLLIIIIIICWKELHVFLNALKWKIVTLGNGCEL